MPLLSFRYTFLCWLLFSLPLTAFALSNTASPVPALDNYFKESLNTRDGLPHNTINALAQTADGYLWFGTWEGVARYNGREFRIFDRSPETGLPDVGVRTFHLDQHKTLWIAGSRGGLVRVKEGNWHAYPPLGVLINRLLLDKQERLWIATEGQGLFMQNSAGERVQYLGKEGLPSEQVHSLIEDSQGRIWVGTSDGLVYLDEQLQIQPVLPTQYNGVPVFALALNEQGQLLVGTERGLFLSPTLTAEPITLLDNVPVSALLFESDDILWIGTIDRGLLRQHDGITEELDIRQGLPNNRILALLLDSEQNLWVGTNGGVFRLRDAPFSTFTTDQGLAGNFVRTVLSHSDGCLYIGTSRGLNRYCAGVIDQIDLSSVSVGQSVLSLAEGPEQSLWVGTYADGLIEVSQGQVKRHFNANNGLPANEVRAVMPLSDGTVWVGTALGASRIDNQGIRNYGREDGLPSPFIMALYQSSDGRVFIGSGAGVAVLQQDKLQSLDLTGLDDADYAFGFAEDLAAGIFWMTTDRGLIAYDLTSGALHMIGRAQGMPFDKLFQLVLDKQGYFWISSNRGVLRLNRAQALEVIAGKRERIEFELFGESDGMASAQANGGSAKAATLHHDGSIWIATSIGVSRVQPERLQQFAKMLPPVVIEKLLVEGQEISFVNLQPLAAGTNRVEIQYAGLGYIMSERIQYRTLLEGFDQEWVNRGSYIAAEYTNLPPGTYRFRVAAAYPGGDWSQNEAELTLEILPYLWQRWWFQLLIVLVLATSLLWVIRWRLQSLKRNELRLLKLVSEQTVELQLLARQDALTGLANRRAFDEALQQEYQRAKRSNATLCLALIDVDHFKQVNDKLSHALGDEVLKRIAALLKQQSRAIDLVARWGGEEFVILLPDTSLAAAIEVCERLRQKLEQLDFSELSADLNMTVSIGLTTNDKLELPQMLLSADRALYQAKRTGRNRLIIADNKI
ncbi:GGDEF domain-containing protein [Alishewanella longhuensis]|uniref:diguanylate cyclase n=1 Tax=Alishewanella longhuensis TaxID=1091037 RepID=A0ABQ3KX04_9ALTE|nr:ligand-binding sensor domain-containing diguanylate cyclase [Alishewanella longhuensis]GHG62082.1 GGDEF domain-containing protein [Alishewanella longhuensis]